MGYKIIWHSNAPWVNTGYGIQTRIFGPRLQELLGHDVTYSAFYGLAGACLQYADSVVLPGYTDPFGNDVLRAHAKFFEPDVVITLHDVWVLDPTRTRTIPWAPWLPIDHDPVPPPVFNTLRDGKATPITFSRFGERKLKEAGFDPVFYVPHGADEMYYEDVDKMEAKAKFDWEDKFVFGVVAANKGWPERKRFSDIFAAFSKLLRYRGGFKKEPILYLHTEQRSPYGIRLDQMLEHYNVPRESVQVVDQYRYALGLEQTYMRDVFNAMDVLVNPSSGEGFGVPILEAQACGTPVIVTNFTAMPELCWFGQKVNGRKFYTNQASWQMLPNVNEIYEAMGWAITMSDTEREKGAADARKRALDYHPDTVTNKYWKPVLEQVYDIVSKRDDIEYGDLSLLSDLDDHKIAMGE